MAVISFAEIEGFGGLLGRRVGRHVWERFHTGGRRLLVAAESRLGVHRGGDLPVALAEGHPPQAIAALDVVRVVVDHIDPGPGAVSRQISPADWGGRRQGDGGGRAGITQLLFGGFPGRGRAAGGQKHGVFLLVPLADQAADAGLRRLAGPVSLAVGHAPQLALRGTRHQGAGPDQDAEHGQQDDHNGARLPGGSLDWRLTVWPPVWAHWLRGDPDAGWTPSLAGRPPLSLF